MDVGVALGGTKVAGMDGGSRTAKMMYTDTVEDADMEDMGTMSECAGKVSVVGKEIADDDADMVDMGKMSEFVRKVTVVGMETVAGS
ncbi:uncharacterized protein A4U43_UnF11660 [Asparagus officinalis]|uniref:Uncharacterized protein n=1 Tax=Asparagus officinalis TaxID=4686 RepID=A0A1R3L580_ASPOF|nr:uncharacterized protein A4U43_UnF11660 [Asparagus officinalis]